jgi:hypothetical protein
MDWRREDWPREDHIALGQHFLFPAPGAPFRCGRMSHPCSSDRPGGRRLPAPPKTGRTRSGRRMRTGPVSCCTRYERGQAFRTKPIKKFSAIPAAKQTAVVATTRNTAPALLSGRTHQTIATPKINPIAAAEVFKAVLHRRCGAANAITGRVCPNLRLSGNGNRGQNCRSRRDQVLPTASAGYGRRACRSRSSGREPSGAIMGGCC